MRRALLALGLESHGKLRFACLERRLGRGGIALGGGSVVTRLPAKLRLALVELIERTATHGEVLLLLVARRLRRHRQSRVNPSKGLTRSCGLVGLVGRELVGKLEHRTRIAGGGKASVEPREILSSELLEILFTKRDSRHELIGTQPTEERAQGAKRARLVGGGGAHEVEAR